MVRAPKAAALASRLGVVDLDTVRNRVVTADLSELADQEELEDLWLIEFDEAPDQIVTEIAGLIAFYTDVAATRRGVAMYSS